jgi:hypothetical protein
MTPVSQTPGHLQRLSPFLFFRIFILPSPVLAFLISAVRIQKAEAALWTMLLDRNFWIAPCLLFFFLFSVPCVTQLCMNCTHFDGPWIGNLEHRLEVRAYRMGNVIQRVQLSIVCMGSHAYECFFYLTRTYFPTALSRQPVSFHAGSDDSCLRNGRGGLMSPHSAACRVGKLYLDAPFSFSISSLLLASLAGDHQRQ